jgi:hypothetical protein
MKIFISWSGNKSKRTAEILCAWLRRVIQAATPWISNNIEKGAKWDETLSSELEETKFGIICLNKENLSAEWLLFEAGALSKTKDARVCTFLLDVKPVDVKPPLGLFQHTIFSKEEIKRLLHTINNKVCLSGESGLTEKDLDEVYEIFWPRLEQELRDLLRWEPAKEEERRSEREILEEILQAVRSGYSIDVILPSLEALLSSPQHLKIEHQGLGNAKVRYAWKNNSLTKNIVENLLVNFRSEMDHDID